MSATARPDTPVTRSDLVTVLVMHQAFLRDTRRLAEAARRLAAGADPGPQQLPALARYVEHSAALLVEHHDSEDELVFPLIAEHLPAPVSAAMASQHEHLDPVLGRVRRTAATLPGGLTPTQLRGFSDDVDRLLGLLEVHLSEEERDTFPAILEHINRRQWAQLQRALQKRASLRQALFFLPWLYEAASSEQAVLLTDELGPPAAFVMRRLQARYRRLSRRAFTFPADVTGSDEQI